MHDLYIKELENEIKDIQKQIDSIKDAANKQVKLLEAKKLEKFIRLNQLRQNQLKFSGVETSIDSHYQSKINDNENKVKATERRIDKLEKERDNYKTKMGKSYATRKIDRQNDKLRSLKSKGARLTGRQRFFMMPRTLYYSFSDHMRSRVNGRIMYSSDQIDDLLDVKKNLNNGLFNNVIDNVIDVRLNYYQRKKDSFINVYNKLGGPMRYNPSNNHRKRNIPKNIINKFNNGKWSKKTSHQNTI